MRVGYSISNEQYERYQQTTVRATGKTAEVLQAIQTEEAALAADIKALKRPGGPNARALESSAGTDMLKARLLSETDSFSKSSIANGQLTTVFPRGGDNGSPHTIYINGINTGETSALGEAQNLANTTNAPIDAIYQQSSIGSVALREAALIAARVALLGPFGGFGLSIARARTDLMKKLENPEAARTAASQIINQLGSPSSSNEARVIGYSQGATITAQALRTVKQELTNRYGTTAANKMMSRVHVLTLGGAARRSDFPSGVELTQIYNKYDIVSQFFGDNKTPLISSLRLGKDILKPHFYMNDQAALKLVADWQKGRLQNQDVMLLDPKLRKTETDSIQRRIPFARPAFA